MYLYIVDCVIQKRWSDGTYPIKIGVTSNLERRICQLQTGNPFQVRYVAANYYESKKEAMEKERQLHNTFSKSRLMGEWFHPKSFIYKSVDFLTVIDRYLKEKKKGVVPNIKRMGAKKTHCL